MANDRVWPEPLAVRVANRQSHGKSAGSSSRHGRMENGNWEGRGKRLEPDRVSLRAKEMAIGQRIVVGLKMKIDGKKKAQVKRMTLS